MITSFGQHAQSYQECILYDTHGLETYRMRSTFLPTLYHWTPLSAGVLLPPAPLPPPSWARCLREWLRHSHIGGAYGQSMDLFQCVHKGTCSCARARVRMPGVQARAWFRTHLSLWCSLKAHRAINTQAGTHPPASAGLESVRSTIVACRKHSSQAGRSARNAYTAQEQHNAVGSASPRATA